MANLSTNPPVGTVRFSATGLPPNSTVTFTPASVSQTGSVTATVNTSGNGHTAALPSFRFGRLAPVYAALIFPLFGWLSIKLRKRKGSKSWLLLGMCTTGLALLLSFAGCWRTFFSTAAVHTDTNTCVDADTNTVASYTAREPTSSR